MVSTLVSRLSNIVIDLMYIYCDILYLFIFLLFYLIHLFILSECDILHTIELTSKTCSQHEEDFVIQSQIKYEFFIKCEHILWKIHSFFVVYKPESNLMIVGRIKALTSSMVESSRCGVWALLSLLGLHPLFICRQAALACAAVPFHYDCPWL